MTIYRVDIAGHGVHPQPWNNESDPLWVSVRPNLRRIHVLAGDMLAGLGKRRDIGGKGRNESQDVTLVKAWLHAHRVHDLVIVDAQRLDPRILLSLIRLATDAQCHLWLLHRPPITERMHQLLARRSDIEATLDNVPVPNDDPRIEPEAGIGLPEVPSHDFHVFRAAVRTQLSPTDAAAVEGHLDLAIAHAYDFVAHHGDAVAGATTALVETLAGAPADSELIVGVRGIQIAAWHHDHHVAVDLPRLLNSEERPRVAAADAARPLLGYRQPHRSIAWLLASRHVGLDDIARVAIGDTSADGSRIRTACGTIDVPDPLAAAVRAQLALRAFEGAGATDPLLPYTTKTLGYAITEAAVDLGLPAHGRRAERRSIAPHQWLKRLGITIRRLP